MALTYRNNFSRDRGLVKLCPLRMFFFAMSSMVCIRDHAHLGRTKSSRGRGEVFRRCCLVPTKQAVDNGAIKRGAHPGAHQPNSAGRTTRSNRVACHTRLLQPSDSDLNLSLATGEPLRNLRIHRTGRYTDKP